MATSRLLSIESRNVVEFEKAVVRRLQAALTPSLIPPPRNPTDRIVIDTVTKLVTSAPERTRNEKLSDPFTFAFGVYRTSGSVPVRVPRPGAEPSSKLPRA